MFNLEASASHPHRAETLGQIASLVGCSVEALAEGRARPDLKEMLELVTLWPMLDEVVRTHLLDMARKATTA